MIGTVPMVPGTDPRLRALLEAVNCLCGDQPLETLLQCIADSAATLLQAECGALYSYGYATAEPLVRKISGTFDAGSLDAILSREPMRGDWARLADMPSIIADPPVWTLCAKLDIPTSSRYLILVQRRAPAAVFAGDDADLLSVFAAQAAAVLRARESEAALRESEAALRVSERRRLDEQHHALGDTFSYTVSHDLRAPLRHINGYVALLKKRSAGVLDATALRYLEAIGSASIRMGRLMDDLRELSNLSRTALVPMQLVLEALVREVIEELRSRYPERRIVWRVAALPKVLGDRGLLRIALGHLLSNAVKFTASRDPAHIEIGCQDIDANLPLVTIYVSDDGVGFEPSYSHKLFGVFDRLHLVSEFEGTGIGLACVKHIVERHGGSVRAEGVLDHGATFYLSLPTDDSHA